MSDLIRIGIVMQTTGGWMGGIIYIQNLIKALALLPCEQRSHLEVYLLTSPRVDPKVYEELKPLVKAVIIEDFLEYSFLNRVKWKIGRILPWFKDYRLVNLANDKKLDFIYPVLGGSNFSWDFKCGWAAWIPDFQHKYLPHLFSTKSITQRDQIFSKIANLSKNIILSSQASTNDFKRFYPYSQAQVHVLNFRTIPKPDWFTGDPELVQQKYRLPDRFFVVSNQFWQHKNHKFVIEALGILKQRNINPVVACTGELYDNRNPKYGDEILDLIKQYGLENQFIILGLIPRLDQIQLMRRSLAVIQPSLFEGWSTVVEDARSLGKIIILSNIDVHLEQNPPDAIFFESDHLQDLVDKIETSWFNLNAGVDLISETQARETNYHQCQVYAQDFLKIVKSAINQ
jgi:glycosyltransferase involved in cell wall biosynthesis